MRAARRDANQLVAGGDRLSVDHLRALDRADAEAGEIVFAIGIHVGHLGRLAADQRGPGKFASRRDTGDDVRRHGHVEPATGEIVEKEQGFRPLHEHVVDAHCDEVDTDRVVFAELLGKHQLGADAVGAGDQHRLTVAVRR